MRPTLLAAVLALALPCAVPAAAAPDGAPSATDFDRIVVTATRTGRALADVPNTVDRIDRERMDERLVRDLRDLFRHEPGITVTAGFGRFGIGDIRIRGLGGNRVRIQTDGIAVSDAFSIGSFANANRDFVELDTLKAVEVVRGPTSSLYGSDALGGTISFITRDPEDFLDGDRTSHLGFRFGYEGDRDGLSANATAAAGGERWSGLLVLGHRQGREMENMGEAGGIGIGRTRPNPQRRDGRSLLARIVYAPCDSQRLRLTLEGNEDDADTTMLAALGPQTLTGAINTGVVAHDHQQRRRVSLSHQVDDAGGRIADALDWQAYLQDSRTTQHTREERDLPRPTLRDVRERSFDFRQRVAGLQLNLRKRMASAHAAHDIAWGLELSRSEARQLRDGLRSFPLTGQATPSMPPDDFPVRDFPISHTTTAALYVQDEITLADGALRLVPGLRVDHYRLRPEMDPVFAEDNPGVALAGLRKTSVAPKLGAVWHFADDWSLFGGYARGFRAPPYADVNIGFSNVMFGYTAIANPSLGPETSDGFELWLRWSRAGAHASLAAYHNRYDDFIESFSLVGMNEQGLLVFQSVNVARARIEGVEFKAGVELGALAPAWQGWSLRGAAAWSRGDDRTAGEPLESVDPATVSLSIAYDAPDWGVELAGRGARRRDRLPSAATADAAWFESPGYALLDLYAHWELAPRATFRLGVSNLADRRVWPAGGVALVDAGSATVDRYTAPGRHLDASLSVAW